MRQSAIGTYQKCPFNYFMRYKMKVETLPNQDANNPLICGTALHYGAETESIEAMRQCYVDSYYCISDLHIHELMKLEAMLPKVLEVKHSLGNTFTHEYYFKIGTFHGTCDLLVHWNESDAKDVDLYDYKYCSEKSAEKYQESPQLHLYKYFLEKLGFRVRKMGFIFIQKTYIRQKKTEQLLEFRQRLEQELLTKEVRLQYLEYDTMKVMDALNACIEMLEVEHYPKNQNTLCDWCEYQEYCEKGEDYFMNLPSTERREIKGNLKRRGWIYGPPMSGKTTMLDGAPTPLMMNSDGNIDNVTAPYISIKDQVSMNGRLKNVQLAWEYFKEVIDELEKKQNDFETIIIDLAEDMYEHCRIWGCKQLGIDHESSQATKAYDYVRSEYLRTMRKLMNLPYENIFIVSHEDISKNIFKQNGDNITRIAPAINEKVANKLAGMVGFVGRVVVDKDDKRWLSFKHDNVTFGGGRLKTITAESIPLDWNELVKIYPLTADVDITEEDIKDEAPVQKTPQQEGRRGRRSSQEVVEDVPVKEEAVQEEPKTEETPKEEAVTEASPVEEAPAEQTTRRRRRRTAEEA